MKLIAKLIFFFYSGASLSFAQLPEQIENAAAGILLSFSARDSVNQIPFEQLNAVMKNEIDTARFEKKYLTSPQQFDSLKYQLAKTENAIRKVNCDSGLVLFNKWYLQFCSTFYNYLGQKFFSSHKIKLLYFSASVSCYCTLEMCKNQLIDIIEFVKAGNDRYDYWTVDSYQNGDLQIKYDTYFSPAVIVFDSDNRILQKIEYDEQMISNLKSFLTSNNN